MSDFKFVVVLLHNNPYYHIFPVKYILHDDGFCEISFLISDDVEYPPEISSIIDEMKKGIGVKYSFRSRNNSFFMYGIYNDLIKQATMFNTIKEALLFVKERLLTRLHV